MAVVEGHPRHALFVEAFGLYLVVLVLDLVVGHGVPPRSYGPRSGAEEDVTIEQRYHRQLDDRACQNSGLFTDFAYSDLR